MAGLTTSDLKVYTRFHCIFIWCGNIIGTVIETAAAPRLRRAKSNPNRIWYGT